MKKLICLLIALIMCTSFVGCQKDGDDQSLKIGIDSIGEYKNGIHNFSVSSTNHEFIKNGKTDYVIVLPAESTENEEYAAQEFNTFLYMSVGTTMPIVKDDALNVNQNSKCIVIGQTKYTISNVPIRYSELSECGYRIKTVGNCIYLCGATDLGTVYSVYCFMEKVFGYRFYAVDEIKIDTVTDLNLPNIDITDRPDFDYRSDNYGEIIRDATLVKRYRMTREAATYLFERNCHNSFTVMPRDSYYYSHRDWYNKDGTQLCYSNDEMIDQYIENLKMFILDGGFDKIVLMGQEDNHSWCDCPDCTESKQIYGVDSAVVVKFANKVSREINSWIEEEYPHENPMTFVVFAYYATNDAPVVFNETTKKYEPVAPEMLFDENVGIRYAAPMDYQKTFFDTEENKDYYEELVKWSAITDTIHYWSYSLYSWELFVPFNSYSSMQTNYKVMLNNGVSCLFDQTKHMQGVSAGFSRLHAFVDCQLMWNVNLNVEDLIEEFFPAYFKDASIYMKKYFDELRVWYDYLYSTTDFGGGWGARVVQEEFWKKPVLERWLSYTDSAKESIAYLMNDNPSLYKKLYNRIIQEELSIRYILIELYRNTYSENVKQQMLMDFYSDSLSLPIETHEELQTLDDLWRRWGIAV